MILQCHKYFRNFFEYDLKYLCRTYLMNKKNKDLFDHFFYERILENY